MRLSSPSLFPVALTLAISAGCGGASSPYHLNQSRAPSLGEGNAPGPTLATKMVACLSPGNDAARESVQAEPVEKPEDGDYATPEAAAFEKHVEQKSGGPGARLSPAAMKAICAPDQDQDPLKSYVEQAAQANSAKSVLVPIASVVVGCTAVEGDKPKCERTEVVFQLLLFGAGGERLWSSRESQLYLVAKEQKKSDDQVMEDVFGGAPFAGYAKVTTEVAEDPAEAEKKKKEATGFSVEEMVSGMDPQIASLCRKYAEGVCERAKGKDDAKRKQCQAGIDKAIATAADKKTGAATCAAMTKKLPPLPPAAAPKKK